MRLMQNVDVGQDDGLTAPSYQRQIELLMEWRDALALIIENNSEAVETGKALRDMEERIASLTRKADPQVGKACRRGW